MREVALPERLAPICLTAYRRPEHTRATLEALLKSPLAEHSTVYAFLDGPKTEDDVSAVAETRAVLEATKGFKDLQVSVSETNRGLASSITSSVSQVVDDAGRVIMIEDDIVTSPAFLHYMNKSLSFYEHSSHIWHVSGYAPDYQEQIRGAYAWRAMNCWGWGTWKDRWQHFEKNPQKLISEFNAEDIHRFNIDGVKNFWNQVQLNAAGAMDTWAIFWYATIFKKNGLCMSPRHSYVQNIGFDGSGENCVALANLAQGGLNHDENPPLVPVVPEDALAVARYQLFLYETVFTAVGREADLAKVRARTAQIVAAMR